MHPSSLQYHANNDCIATITGDVVLKEDNTWRNLVNHLSRL